MPLVNCELIFKTKETIVLCFKTFFISLIFFFWFRVWAPKLVNQYQKPSGYGTDLHAYKIEILKFQDTVT